MVDQLLLFWFDQHWIASTFFTPGCSFIWACWKLETGRAIAAGSFVFFLANAKASK